MTSAKSAAQSEAYCNLSTLIDSMSQFFVRWDLLRVPFMLASFPLAL